MDLKQLRLLCALGDTRHFKKAAEACFISQPALSMRLKALEDEFGVPLVLRKQRFEGFTPEGERLLQHARAIIAGCDAMKQEVNALRGQVMGSVRLGMVPLADFSPIQQLDELRAQHPQLRFELRSLPNDAVLDQLNNNLLDVGVVYSETVNTQHFHLHDLGGSLCHLLYHPENLQLQETIEQKKLTWQQVADLPLSLLTGGNFVRQFLDKQMLAQGLTLMPVLETDSTHELLQVVDAGMSATIIPGEQLGGMNHTQLRAIPIKPLCKAPSLGLVMKRSEPAPVVSRLVYEHLSATGMTSA